MSCPPVEACGGRLPRRRERKSALPRPLCALLLVLCLGLPGCGAGSPDKGSLSPVRADRGGVFHLEVSGRWVDIEALSAAISETMQRGSVMRPADGVDAHTLVVKVEVREMFRAGTVKDDSPGWLDSAFDDCLARHAVDSGLVLGSALGMAAGIEGGKTYAPGHGSGIIWAMRVAVGMARGRTPDKLEELVVSTGKKRSFSRKEAIPEIGRRLAERICKAIMPAAGDADGK